MNATLLLLAATAASANDVAPPESVDVRDAIECRLDAPVYNGFAFALQDEEHAIAKKRGWTKIESKNFSMNEYELPEPITVAKHYSTKRIGFTSNGVIAILDLPDPEVIAKEVGIKNAMDPNPLIDMLVASGKVTREQVEKEMPFRKYMGQKLVLDRRTPPDSKDGFGFHILINQEIANASTHPGKTFYGCSYSMKLTDKNGKPL